MSERIAQGLLLVLISLFVLTLSVCKAAPMTDYIPESEALTNGETQVSAFIFHICFKILCNLKIYKNLTLNIYFLLNDVFIVINFILH